MTGQDDQMHGDTSSGSLTSSSFSSSTLNLARVDLDKLNVNMKSEVRAGDWFSRIQKAKDDPEIWRRVAADVLMCFTSELADTGLKDSIIASPNLQDSLDIVKGFNNEEFQQWKSGMQTGVEKNDWVGLINHPTAKLRTSKVPNVAPGVPIEYQEAVIRAWNLPYYGDAHKVLLRAIDQLHKCSYAKIIPIVQSSGTGKSKTVDEVSKLRILFPMCLREEIGENYFAYPHTDKVVRNHLELAPSTTDKVECKQYLESFLSALFTSAHLQAQELFRGPKKVSYEHMAETFHSFFADQKQKNGFYAGVVQKAKKYPDTSAWDSFKGLMDVLKDRCNRWLPETQCPILISMDEVHVLYKSRGLDHGSDYTLYEHMMSVLNEGVKHGFGVLTLSTAIHTSSIGSSKKTPLSMRERDEGRTLPPPFTELPFDVYIIKGPLISDQATFDSVGSLEFTAKFGRPLFYSSYLTRKCLPNIIGGIMGIVKEKLSGRPWPPEARADIVDTSSIAVISARLHLDLSLATVYAKPYEEELVRNHLRMLYSVDGNQQIFVTGSSPEPLIAEASAQIMNYSLTRKEVKEPYMDLWNLLGKFVDHGLVSQGVIGQLIGRALSISAMDCAINRLSDVCELRYQTPVSVTDYYKALLTTDAWDDLRQSMPANRAQLDHNSAIKTFEEAFQDAYFHFSHYAKAGDSSPMQDTHTWALWLRGTAVVCEVNQEATDRMMPIYFSSRGNVSPKTISVNLEQDKTDQSVNPVDVAIQSAKGLHGNKLPYIAVVHRYASTENEGISITPPSPYELRGQIGNDPEGPRYQIDFHGLSAYGHITHATRTLIRNMINRSKNAIFKDHSRQYGVDSLRRMLPMLTADRASTEWFKVPRNAKQENSVPPNKKQKTNHKSTASPSTAGSRSRKRK